MSVTTTRKELIIKKYNCLLKSLNNKDIINVLPSLDEMDLADIIYFFNLYFENGYYKESLLHLLELKDIKLNDEEFDDMYDIVFPFIVWLKYLP